MSRLNNLSKYCYICGAKLIEFTTNQNVYKALKIKQCPRSVPTFGGSVSFAALGALPYYLTFNFLLMRNSVKTKSKLNNSTLTFTADSRNESNLSLQSFQFNQNTVRVFINEKLDPEFCASDVCTVLGYLNSRDAIKKHCKLNGVAKRDTLTNGGKQSVVFISEGNLYRLIIKSNKQEAEPFESWVCDEVLPTIRKTGSYQIKKPVNFNEVVQNCQYCTVIGYWKYHGYNLTTHQAKMVSIFCDNLSRNLGYESCKVQIGNFGKVRAYHTDILELIFNDSTLNYQS